MMTATMPPGDNMDVVITFAQYVPPAGTIRRPGEDPVAFSGRLGLVQAIDDLLARTSGLDARTAQPGQLGGELDASPHSELGQHMGDVRGDGVPGHDQPCGDLGIGQPLPG